MRKGLFVVVEGVDGAGKTTMCQKLSERLGKKVFYDQNLKYHVNTDNYDLDILEHFNYFKRQIPVIEECIKKNKIYLSDRWVPSTYVYQGLPNDRVGIVDYLETYLLERKPDITIILYFNKEFINNGNHFRRVAHRNEVYSFSSIDLINQRYTTTWRGIRDVFYINADQDLETILEEIIKIIEIKNANNI